MSVRFFGARSVWPLVKGRRIEPIKKLLSMINEIESLEIKPHKKSFSEKCYRIVEAIDMRTAGCYWLSKSIDTQFFSLVQKVIKKINAFEIEFSCIKESSEQLALQLTNHHSRFFQLPKPLGARIATFAAIDAGNEVIKKDQLEKISEKLITSKMNQLKRS